jgi:hypothetical protein
MLRTPQIPKQVKFTTWRNPLSTKAVMDITTDGAGDTKGGIGVLERYEIEPGETCEIPSQYDWAVQNTYGGNANAPAVILGGLGPQLINETLPPEKRPVLHAALDTEKAKLRAAEAEAAATAVMQKQAEAAAMLMATGVAKAMKADKKADK